MKVTSKDTNCLISFQPPPHLQQKHVRSRSNKGKSRFFQNYYSSVERRNPQLSTLIEVGNSLEQYPRTLEAPANFLSVRRYSPFPEDIDCTHNRQVGSLVRDKRETPQPGRKFSITKPKGSDCSSQPMILLDCRDCRTQLSLPKLQAHLKPTRTLHQTIISRANKDNCAQEESGQRLALNRLIDRKSLLFSLFKDKIKLSI